MIVREIWEEIQGLPFPMELGKRIHMYVDRHNQPKDSHYDLVVRKEGEDKHFYFVISYTDEWELHNYLLRIRKKDLFERSLQQAGYEVDEVSLTIYAMLYMVGEAYMYSIVPMGTLHSMVALQQHELKKFDSTYYDNELKRIDFIRKSSTERMKEEFALKYLSHFLKKQPDLWGMVKRIFSFQ